MPIIKSAKKRVRVSNKATIRNAKTKRTMRESIKAFYKALESGKTDVVNSAHQKADSAIDTASKKNVIHKNKASRKKSQLSQASKKAGVKLTSSAKTKTVATKKPVAKKSTPKAKASTKPAAKKASAK